MAVHGYTKNYKLIKPEFNSDTWHDYEYENLDVIDAVLSAIYASGQWRGFWKNDTLYHELDVVIDRNTDTMYKVAVEHTTDDNVTFADYMFNHPEYYQLWSPNNLAKDWAIKDDGLADNQDYSAKAYAIGGVGTETNNAKYYSEQAGIQAGVSTEQAAASASSATASYNSEQLALSHANNSAVSASASALSAEQSAASATLSQEQAELSQSHAEYAADEVAGLEAFTQEKQAEILASVNAALTSAEEARRYAAVAQGGNICDIGTALWIDENKGLRRWLNGQVIAINDNTQAFLTKLESIQATTPSLFVDEATWQAAASLNPQGLCDKFVIDTMAGTIRLPKYPDYIVTLGTGGVKGNGMTLGLTTGTTNYGLGGAFTGGSINASYTAAFSDNYGTPVNTQGYNGTAAPAARTLGVTTDPDKSGIVLADDAVQTLTLHYFIQIATGAEEESTIINTLELNNPFTLFDSKYSDHEINNLSWLLSDGGFKSGATYVTAYEALLIEMNSGVAVGTVVTLPSGTSYTKQGLPVIASTESYTDYDYVVNTTDSTFRLPLKTKLASGKAVVGNGMTLGLTDGTNNAGLVIRYDNTNGSRLGGNIPSYGSSVGTTASNSGYQNNFMSLGITTDSDKSGIETSDNGLYLYYYIGETVQNANLIDVSNIQTYKADKSEVSFLDSPSERYEDIPLLANDAPYYAPDDGWVSIRGSSSQAAYITLSQIDNNEVTSLATYSVFAASSNFGGRLKVKKGQQFTINATSYFNRDTAVLRFVYAEGSK